MNATSRLLVLVVLILCVNLTVLVKGESPASFISIFQVRCADNSLCPSDIDEATLEKAAGRTVADQCCQYFRSGCCSQAENEELTKWFQLTLGLCIGVPLLMAILIAVVVSLCVYCRLRYTRSLERPEKDIFKSHTKSSSLEYWHSNESYSKPEKALFHY